LKLLALLTIVACIVASSYYKGHIDGHEAHRRSSVHAAIQLNLEIQKLQRDAEKVEQKRLIDMSALEETIGALQRDAIKDPNSSRPSLGINSVRRLNAAR
jgi:hypothetical protein